MNTWPQCINQVFSAARIEQNTARIEDTTLRIEQRVIVNGVENQVRLQQLQGMMAGVLLNTSFGQNFMHQTIEIMTSVSGALWFSFKATNIFVQGSNTPDTRVPVSFCTDHMSD
jgi:hypothetical protein